MPLKRRKLLRVLAFLVGLGLVAALAVVLVLRSSWFQERVRLYLVSTVENATGGRVEISTFGFDWRALRAEVTGFVLHGTEPAGKPPLAAASRVTVNLKLISLARRDVDIQALVVEDPRIFLTIAPDGRTNVPEPKVARHSQTSTLEDILKLAIARFQIDRGIFEVETHGRIPFSARGEKLDVHLAYDRAKLRYNGTLAMAPLLLSYDDYGPTPFEVQLAVAMEKNRVAVESAVLTTGSTRVSFHGALEDLAAPRARFEYQSRVALPDIGRIFRVPELRAGTGIVNGTGEWTPAAGLALSGQLHATGVEYRDSAVRLVGFQGDGAVSAGVAGVFANGLRLSGFYVRGTRREAVGGTVGRFALRGKDIDIDGIGLTVMGGTFQGKVGLRRLDLYSINGAFIGVDARRTVAMYSPQPLPWDALVFGAATVEGSLKRARELRATGHLTLAPAPGSDPVSGEVHAAYDARRAALDLGRSTLRLPHSQLDVSGTIDSELRVHLVTRDLNDLLPVLGESAAAVPVKLTGGEAAFEGSVTGNLDSPRIAGRLSASNFSYTGEHLDALAAEVAASGDLLRVRNGTAARAGVRAQFEGSIGLSQWKTSPTSPVAASATLRNAGLADLAALLHAGALPVTGTLSGSARVNGTLGAPRAESDLDLSHGAIGTEPFDRFRGHAAYAGETLTLTNGELFAGRNSVQISGTYRHQPDRFGAGRLRVEVATNSMALESIHAAHEFHAGLKGTVQVTAGGQVDLSPTAPDGFRLEELHAGIAASGVQLDGLAVGQAQLTVRSEGSVVRTHLESTVSGVAVNGDGEWRLAAGYPGAATINISAPDLARLHPWLSSASGEAPRFAGATQAVLRVEGPARDWRAMKAELRIASLYIAPAPDADIAAETLSIRNAGPIVLRYAASTLTVESAHLVGRSTDVSISGRVLTGQKNPLDLRVDGRIDLAFLRDLSKDFMSSGSVVTEAAIRGSWSDPQLNGRLRFENAAFNIVDVPNGISKASGTVVFTRDRATIQNLTGETGGGQIELSGFASYGGGPLVFRLHARAREVRVRYPEGVSTVANANLNLTGTAESSMLSGTFTVLRTGINLQSDFSSFLARSAEPVETPAARKGLLGGMSFDVQIVTAPDIQLQSSLTENLQAEANLRLRGTVSNPAVLGRVNITQGKLTFFGTKYRLSQGSIAFYNPVKVEPILNIDLETKARGIDITLTISGPLTKLSLTPRSDPPLEFSEIVALLATGRAPTSDPSLIKQQSSEPQSWQQMGASALLGSAIANPVAGRLQRFFGVSKLRIDPTLSGVENNPQARLTLEQQVTPAITFTYITNVTQSNPQVVQVEWALSSQWSAVALREENGLFGLDFFYKRRFK